MIKENIPIYEAIMSESSSLKFHLELLRLIPKNYSISSLELREKLLALGIERDLRSIQRALNTLRMTIHRRSSSFLHHPS